VLCSFQHRNRGSSRCTPRDSVQSSVQSRRSCCGSWMVVERGDVSHRVRVARTTTRPHDTTTTRHHDNTTKYQRSCRNVRSNNVHVATLRPSTFGHHQPPSHPHQSVTASQPASQPRRTACMMNVDRKQSLFIKNPFQYGTCSTMMMYYRYWMMYG